MISIAINGAAGRMGRRLIALAHEDPQFRIADAADRADCPALGQDAGALAGIGPIGVAVQAGLSRPAQVAIDFSVPEVARQVLAYCTPKKMALVLGTTGLSAADHMAIDDAAQSIAILQAPNMSLGINLLLALAAQTAKRLGDAYDIEIAEAHHHFKKDAPSGTALALAQAICQATGKDPNKDVVHGRHGPDVPRRPGQIGVHALRMGDVVGEHTVYFAAAGERLELTHIATNRDVFVRGALRAAAWIAGKPAGRYAMADVLGIVNS
jgi:4-hydroxy-tetrahydrodipicolinate reductase